MDTATLTNLARQIGTAHRAAGATPFGTSEHVRWHDGSATLLNVLGITGDTTDENHDDRADIVNAYCDAVDGENPAPGTAAGKVALITAILDTHNENNEADDGDKILASTGYAMEAIDAVLREGNLDRLVREGWFDADTITASAT